MQYGDINNISKFTKFLRNHRKKINEKCSHTSCGPPYGAFNITELEEFNNLYKNALSTFDKNNINSALHMIEMPLNNGPLAIDLDFEHKEKDRQYNGNHIKNITKIFTSKIKEYLDVPDDKIEAYIFEKIAPTFNAKNGLHKDGIHIIYPKVNMSASLRYYITEKTRDEVRKNKILNDIELFNDIDDVFDISVVMRTGWTMFGSCKPGHQRYNLTSIFDMNNNKININYSLDELVELLSIRRFDQNKQIKLSNKYNTDEFKNELKMIYEKYHPIEKQIVSSQIKNIIDSDNNDVILARKLIKLLSKKRATNYNTWIRVGWTLRNIDDCLFWDFTNFSKKCPSKYDEEACKKIWKTKKDYGFTISSLYFWAEEDNPKKLKNMLSNK